MNATDITIEELLERYLVDRAPEVVDAADMRAHAQSIDSFFGRYRYGDFRDDAKALPNLCRKYAEVYSTHSKGTVNKRLRILQSALKHAAKKEIIPSPLNVWLPGNSDPRARALTDRERGSLLATADAPATEPHIRTFVYLTLFTGLNRRRITALKWKDIDLEAGKIHVSAAGRSIDLADEVRPVLARAREKSRSEYVVEFRGKRVVSVYGGLKALFTRAGIKNFTAVDLRLAQKVRAQEQKSDQSQHLFISYCFDDGKRYADDLVRELEESGDRHKCWIAPRNVKAGAFPGQLARAINAAAAVIVIVTPAAQDSADVLREVLKAHMSKKVVIPIIVNRASLGDDLGYYLEVFQRIDWTDSWSVARDILARLDWSRSP